jgi:hypothetical protein
MPKKKPPAPNEKPQHERFKDAARKIGASDEKAFERAFGKIVPPVKPKKREQS